MKKWYFLLLTCLTSVSLQAADYVRTQTGLSLSSPKGNLRIDFITPDIVRVRYTQETAFLGNGTIACLERKEEIIPFTVKEEKGRVMAVSDSISVNIDLKTQAISYYDAKTGRLLLQEANRPRNCERIVQENVTYDESTKRTIETADGKKEVMDVLRRDTIGHTWRLSNHFVFQPQEALYGLGSHM